jgi:hypothetical protein
MLPTPTGAFIEGSSTTGDRLDAVPSLILPVTVRRASSCDWVTVDSDRVVVSEFVLDTEWVARGASDESWLVDAIAGAAKPATSAVAVHTVAIPIADFLLNLFML